MSVAPAWESVDALLDPAAEAPDAWLAAGPWPQLVDQERERRDLQPLFSSEEGVAATPLVAIIENRKLASLPCAGEPTWACVAGAAVGMPVTLRFGMPDPAVEAAGSLVMAASVGSAIGLSEYARNDYEGLPAESLAVGLRDTVEGSARRGGDSPAVFLGSSGGAFLDAWAGTEAELRRLLADAARAGSVTLVTPAPRALVTATLGVREGVDLDGDQVEETLASLGWSLPPPEEAEDGLPSPGVLVALSELIR